MGVDYYSIFILFFIALKVSSGSRGEQKKNAIQLQRVFPVSIDMDTVFDALLLRIHVPHVGHGHCTAHCGNH